MSRKVIGLFAKEPRAGRVKTRLARDLGEYVAAELYTAFLVDSVAKLLRIDARRVVAFSPPAAEPVFRALLPPGVQLIAQAQGDLGQRMQRFFENQLSQGADRVVLIGSDSPTLPSAWLDDAFDALAAADVVLGPSLDGGYYLVGCRARVPPIFEGIAWSTPWVLAQTVARLGTPGPALRILPPWYDIDTPAELHLLAGHLAALRRAGVELESVQTERVMADLARRGIGGP